MLSQIIHTRRDGVCDRSETLGKLWKAWNLVWNEMGFLRCDPGLSVSVSKSSLFHFDISESPKGQKHDQHELRLFGLPSLNASSWV